ncbi:MAG: N-acetylmuramoyl-L-alanine amidase-like domain-containing protein [Deferribacterales bacterium]
MKNNYKYILLIALAFIFGFSYGKVGSIISQSSKISATGDRIAFISEKFLGTKYKAGTLISDPEKSEKLVINLEGMDCFTFLDYVEALRLSKDSDDFTENLKKVRYFNGIVSYKNRKHFFTDWVSGENNTVKDITSELPGSITVEKYINRKSDTKNWLKNLPQTMRMITYIPANLVSKDVVKLLQNGDYVGVYADKEGLDVTHTGIFIRNSSGEFFRNTSSIAGEVTDYNFKDYMKDIKGIIVFRAI